MKHVTIISTQHFISRIRDRFRNNNTDSAIIAKLNEGCSEGILLDRPNRDNPWVEQLAVYLPTAGAIVPLGGRDRSTYNAVTILFGKLANGNYRDKQLKIHWKLQETK